MAYMCLEADECRVFIKNGKLRFQARKMDDNEEVSEQVTISLPKECLQIFNNVKSMDSTEFINQGSMNRINHLLSDNLDE